MRIDSTLSADNPAAYGRPLLRADPSLRADAPPEAHPPAPAEKPAPAVAEIGNIALCRLIGDVDIRRLSPRQMAETSMDLYVAGILPWEEYALLAFQAELHPDYDKTIGALTGEPAAPDRPRDFLHLWEERLRFEETYNADNPHLVERTRHIVQTFRQIAQPTNLVA